MSLQLSVPSSLNLLPGQIHMLKAAVEKEKERIKKGPPPAVTSSPYISLQADMPAWVLTKLQSSDISGAFYYGKYKEPIPRYKKRDQIIIWK